MPKVVDNYVLQRRVGSGQYGDVFKGFNRSNNMDIAIKVINREKLKGKFNELLENQIKVLKSCNNPNIIKLYDIKKTAHNYYLILEFCNEGDLMVFLKQKKYLPEQQAIEILVQIINAFKDLVKNKIVHRDFKLANILKHDGNIKIADFGFAKLLPDDDPTTQTILGSPLNMAPEVLNSKEYNSKVDIWSIGTVFYELLFGKPPYTAGSIVQLIKKINSKPFSIPKKDFPISEETEDVLRKMLVVDPNKRIDWEDLFRHPILSLYEDKIKKDLRETLNQEDLMLNMSKFYLKNNMVVDHPAQIQKKEEINNFACEVVKGKKVREFNGQVVKRKQCRQESEKTDVETVMKQVVDDQKYEEKETKRQKQIKAIKRNAEQLLHFRNIYVFLAKISEECSEKNLKNSEICSFYLLRRLISLLEWLRGCVVKKENVWKMDEWEAFLKSKQFRDIQKYITKQYDIFVVFYERTVTKIRNSSKYKELAELPTPQLYGLEKSQKNYYKFIVEYARQYISLIIMRMRQNNDSDKFKPDWIFVLRLLDCVDLQGVFSWSQGYNFRQYYDKGERLQTDQLIKLSEQKFKEAKKII